jgi:hypothetical protein
MTQKQNSRIGTADVPKAPNWLVLSSRGWSKVPSVMTGGKPWFYVSPDRRQTIVWNFAEQRWQHLVDGVELRG